MDAPVSVVKASKRNGGVIAWLLSAVQDELPILSSLFYAAYVSFFACSIDQSQFIAYVVVARVLLAVPYTVPYLRPSTKGLFQVTLATIAFMLWQGYDVIALMLNRGASYGYAVKALGVDYLVLSYSVLLWLVVTNYMRTGRGLTKEKPKKSDEKNS
ncbi:MAG: hypothetical protein M1828_006445 [Chrysothrix sp. TS-e1954]|nr:MAG: hypothetical protein M1828_006445 [Chrysothrix sp. TS-e1954]